MKNSQIKIEKISIIILGVLVLTTMISLIFNIY